MSRRRRRSVFVPSPPRGRGTSTAPRALSPRPAPTRRRGIWHNRAGGCLSDILGPLFGLLICGGVPVMLLVGLGVLLGRRGDGNALESRIDSLELQLGAAIRSIGALERENSALKRAQQSLAARVSSLPSTGGPVED